MCGGSRRHEDSLAGRERVHNGGRGGEGGEGEKEGETFLRDPATYFIYDPQEVLQFVLQMIPRKSAPLTEHKSEPPPPPLPPSRRWGRVWSGGGEGEFSARAVGAKPS